MYINTYTNTYRYIRTQIHKYIRTQIHKYIRTQIHKYIPTQLHKYIPTQLHKYIPTHLHKYIPTQLHIYTNTQIHTNTYTFPWWFYWVSDTMCGSRWFMWTAQKKMFTSESMVMIRDALFPGRDSNFGLALRELPCIIIIIDTMLSMFRNVRQESPIPLRFATSGSDRCMHNTIGSRGFWSVIVKDQPLLDFQT
jgi:hypothetical protein